MTRPATRAGRVTRTARGRAAPRSPAPAPTPAPSPGQLPDAVEPPLHHRSPFAFGLFAAVGALLAWWLGGLLLSIGSILVLVVVSMFLAVGLNPAVEWLGRHDVRRSIGVLMVVLVVLGAVALFLVALVPVIADQVSLIVTNAPTWLSDLQGNDLVQKLDSRYDVISRLERFVTGGSFGSAVFGGFIGVSLKVLSVLANIFVVVVLTLYFLAALPQIKRAGYRLSPASSRPRVTELGDRILRGVGGYVAGAFLVATAAGLSSLVFLLLVGLQEYAVALAAVVTLLDVIPMIGATLGAVVVCAIGFATDLSVGVWCVIFFVAYQQFENYVVYPRVMSRSVDLPGAVIVIAALIGGSLLGVVGALMAVPTAAAIALLARELLLPRQEAR